MFGADGTIRHAAPILKNSRQKEDIPRDLYPLLVTFKDINDPASVQLVEPDQLTTIFGSDIKLKRITLEITDKPVTRGKVEKVLGWAKTRNIPVNKNLPYKDPMRNLSNSFMRR